MRCRALNGQCVTLKRSLRPGPLRLSRVLPEKLAAFYAVSVHAADLEKDFATSLPRLGLVGGRKFPDCF